MKKDLLTLIVLSLLFLLFCDNTYAQNYSTVVPGKINYYERTEPFSSGNKFVEVMKIDSLTTFSSKTIYFPYRSFNGEANPATNCLEYKDTCWMGNKIISRNNGSEVFYNRLNDSIVLKSNAALNQTWHVYEFSNGDYIEGKLSSVIQQTILGSLDSVKIITLQTKNSGGTNITNDFNNKNFILSKTNGIVQCYNFYQFPNDTNSFNLKGKDIPTFGTQNLTAFQIFDFSLGDVFEHIYKWNGMINGSTFAITRKTLFNKYVSANNDTLIYKFDRLNYSKNYFYTPSFDSTIVTEHDTITNTIVVSEWKILNGLSVELNTDTISEPAVGIMNAQWHNATVYNNRMQKIIYPNYNPFGYPDCVVQLTGWCIYHNHYFAAGLGLTEKRDDTGGFDPNSCGHTYMSYYSKGSEIWGTAQDWATLVDVKIISKNEISYKVFPNPAKEKINFSFPTFFSGKLFVYSATGEISSSSQINSTFFTCEFPKNGWNGIYFYKIISDEGKISSGKFVVE